MLQMQTKEEEVTHRFEWCKEAEVVPYVQRSPSQESPAFRIQLLPGSGACSSLLGVLASVMYAQKRERAYFLDESETRLKGSHPSWYLRYFQPIGSSEPLSPFEDMPISSKEVRKFAGMPQLTIGSETMWRVNMKRTFLRRYWQFLPSVRQEVCGNVRQLGLPQRFFSIMVRRGDKITVENRSAVPLEHYIDTLQSFQGISDIRDVFVGTDDCSVLEELRGMAPSLTFHDFCYIQNAHGWDLKKDVTHDLDSHFLKFFAELTVMSASDIFIGDRASNVFNWVLYMRRSDSRNATVFNVRDYPYGSVGLGI